MIDTEELARAAARRFLAREHQALVRTLDRRAVATAVFLETALAGDPDPSLIDATIEQIKAARIGYMWRGEEPMCGAEPEDLLAEMGCKPCSLPAGHDGHRYPYPMPLAPGLPGCACGICGSLFTPAGEPRDEHSRHGDSPWCRGCADQCHEGGGGHSCAICTPADERTAR